MKRLQLPDGSYVHPATIHKISVAEHFFGKKYYVQMTLTKGGSIDLRTRLSLEEAREIKQYYERELESLHTDTSAYEDGYRDGEGAGRENGYQIGYENGRGEGYNAGWSDAQQQIQQNNMQIVIDQLEHRLSELLDEKRFEAHLIEPRRLALAAMIELLEDTIARLR